MPERKNVDKMIPKRKRKVVQKQKQKQKQKQSQIVNVNIGSSTVRKARKRVQKATPILQIVNPVQYLYQASASSKPLIPPVVKEAEKAYEQIGRVRPLARPNMYDRDIGAKSAEERKNDFERSLSVTPEVIARRRTKFGETSPLTQDALDSVAKGGARGRPQKYKTDEERKDAQRGQQKNYRERKRTEKELGVPAVTATPLTSRASNVDLRSSSVFSRGAPRNEDDF